MDDGDQGVPKLKRWQVAGGILLRENSVLLVENVRRNGSVDWSTPGGVVDAGESVLEGLTREVDEETGLLVTEWSDLAYQVVVTAADAGFILKVDAFSAVEFGGLIVIDDPDGIVVSASYVDLDKVADHMHDGPKWVIEPLVSYLSGATHPGQLFEYEMQGKGKGGIVKRVV